MTMNVLGYAANSGTDALAPFHFGRREPRANDVVIEILSCVLCHSDLHNVRYDWGGATHPMPLGQDAIRVVGAALDADRADLESWRDISATTEFPG
ncbi:MAG: hypothetical protein P4L33_13445 [Capsulimonadaceae bacterium]|nr:hypothetical protein [Capsulimonadaceae bacterium]